MADGVPKKQLLLLVYAWGEESVQSRLDSAIDSIFSIEYTSLSMIAPTN